MFPRYCQPLSLTFNVEKAMGLNRSLAVSEAGQDVRQPLYNPFFSLGVSLTPKVTFLWSPFSAEMNLHILKNLQILWDSTVCHIIRTAERKAKTFLKPYLHIQSSPFCKSSLQSRTSPATPRHWKGLSLLPRTAKWRPQAYAVPETWLLDQIGSKNEKIWSQEKFW